MKDLAIIIPAYKRSFLEDALSSIACQTCKDFIVYIGDDNSPNDLSVIVSKFKSDIDIVYHHFDDNMGGSDLVAHWERCIRLSQGEPWIWLFSDDDMMEPECVELFYKKINNPQNKYDLYHFDVKLIDDSNRITSVPKSYPDVYQSYEYYKAKMNGHIMSLVVENIFSREIWERKGGFQNFDLAWGSDTATWIKFMQDSGMCTIRGAFVHWRCSAQNISPDVSSTVVKRKMAALVNFYTWSRHFFFNGNIDIRWFNMKTYVQRMCGFKPYVDFKVVKSNNRSFCEHQGLLWLLPFINCYIKIR